MILKVIHKITALFLTFVLLANSINNVVIVTDFVINQDFIAKTLCIQKEEQKGCNGKCQLRKELVQNNTDGNSDAPSQNSNRTRLDVFVISEINLNTDLSNINLQSQHFNSDLRLFQPISKFYDLDTPPPILS
ncbi:hypothetical protein [Winogradskyella alexanderae]|jgi:hypothetical protein|uniref:Secreted protein n=1 Tax=Winogradskyella alexanderae TaxID=2877123 RepID=A0ABS7XT35_9FLAO|nr:hypothetical protein [Winogradskyella alexanderae]MCA0132945.1 hypothetical protein [Winogradskyella alexanderae]